MVKIELISQPTFDKNNVLKGSGIISLTNGVDIWFSPIHKLKTERQAKNVANIILNALNHK